MDRRAAFGIMMWQAGAMIGIGAASLDAAFWAGTFLSLWGAVYYVRFVKAE